MKGALIASGSLARKFPVPDNWRILRLGIRLDFAVPSPAAPTNTPRLALGFCSGVDQPFHSSSVIPTANFVGIVTTSNPWTAFTGFVRSTVQGATRVGTTLTTAALSNSTNWDMGNTSPTTSRRTMAFVTVVRRQPTSYRVWFYRHTSSAPSDRTLADFTLDMDRFVAWGWRTGYNEDFANLTVDEATNGPLNAVNIFYDKDNPPIVEVSEFAVADLTEGYGYYF